MKLGVNLINFGPAAGPDTFRQWVRVVEGLGYHSIMISDHIAITKDVLFMFRKPMKVLELPADCGTISS